MLHRKLLALVAIGCLAGLPLRTARATQADYETAPPRLSFTEGEVSFFREGAEDWTAARVNTALDAGDELYVGPDANLEIQIGPRAFVRAGEQSRLALRTLEPDFLQLELASGTLSLDVRDLPASHTLAIATPNAAFTVEQAGYYRVDVTGDDTSFTSRRGGHATLTSASGQVGAIAASEQVVVAGLASPSLGTYAAPELDDWDRWNYRRTDQQIDSLSARYVPANVYGVDDLDYYGTWRVVPTYGAVWVPRSVAVGWAPYTVGRWMWDVRFGWTWVDAAPWGWAPFHYGRWVRVHGYWAWAPGPIVRRAVYAPALVAFFGDGVSIGVGVAPAIGWVALGWGEPCVPWWGPVGYVGHAHWLGWGGPRVVNKVVIKKTTVVNVTHIHEYEHEHDRGAAVFVRRDRFGRGPVREARIERAEIKKFKPVRGELPVRPAPTSFSGGGRHVRRPAEVRRPLVAIRDERAPAPPAARTARAENGRSAEKRSARRPQPRLVPAPKRSGDAALPRPPFGRDVGSERARPAPPPRFARGRREEPAPQVAAAPERRERSRETRATGRPAPPVASRVPSRARKMGPPAARRQGVARPQAAPKQRAQAPSRPPARERAQPSAKGRAESRSQGRVEGGERAAAPKAELPGEPANRTYRGTRGSRGSGGSDRGRHGGGRSR